MKNEFSEIRPERRAYFIKITKYLFEIIPWRSLQPQAVDVSPVTGPCKEKYQRKMPFGPRKKMRPLWETLNCALFCTGQRVFSFGLWLERPPRPESTACGWRDLHGIILNRYFVILRNSLLCLRLFYYFGL